MDILDKYAKVMNDRDILNEHIIEILDEIFKGMIKVFWINISWIFSLIYYRDFGWNIQRNDKDVLDK